MNASLLPSSPTPLGAPPSVSPTRRKVRRAGWIIAAVTSIAAGVLGLIPTGSEDNLLILFSLILLLLLSMMVAAGLLIGGYHEFSGRGHGVATWVAVFMLAIYLSRAIPTAGLSPLPAAALTVITLWGVVASLAIGPTLLLYLIRTDRSVIVFAITYLLLVWLMFSLGQYLGWDILLQRLIFGATGDILWPVQALLCGSIWVTITATLAFIWNTALYFSREWAGVRQSENQTAP